MKRIYEPEAYGEAARAGCFWQPPAHDWPRLEGARATDIAIIGAGYTGLSAALHLAEAGAEVAVLEAEAPGWGASGRNGGFCCMGGSKLGEDVLARRYGGGAARAFVAQQRAAVELVERLIEAHDIIADTHSDGEVELAHRPGAMADLAAEAKRLASHGIKANLLSRSDLESQGLAGPEFHGGLHVKLGFALDPAKYAHGLARAAERAGAEIFAASPVTRIRRTGAQYMLTIAKGELRARRLILATNGYSSEDIPPWLRARYLPVQSNIMVTRPLSAQERAAQGWSSDLMAFDSRKLLHYFRLLPDGRFLFGMRGNIRADHQSLEHMRHQIRQHFIRMFPAWKDIEAPHFWSGLICMARRQVPFAGPIGDWPNAWAGMAYHGNGVAMGTLTGALLADMALGRGAPGMVLGAPLRRFPLGRARRALLRPAFAWYNWRDG